VRLVDGEVDAADQRAVLAMQYGTLMAFATVSAALIMRWASE
jgi:hypothetical protein